MAIKPTNQNGSGGSALKRLRSSLRTAGVVGNNSKASRSKKNRKKGLPIEAGKNDINTKLLAIRDEFNPFEIKKNHKKFNVLGRQVKGDSGKPTLSKQVGEDNRKKTLLVELQSKDRTGGIIDRRFGENNPNLTVEEKMLERFTKEQQRRVRSGKSIFNIDDGDDEDGGIGLTHSGKSLADMDDYDNAGLGISDDEDDKGHLDKSIVSKLHFGGFGEDEEPEEGERKKTKNEVMKELIAKSKMHKYERQLAKQQDEEIREGLDEDLANIRELLDMNDSRSRKPLPSQNSLFRMVLKEEQERERENKKPAEEDAYSDYDRLIKELAHDRRAQAAERTKTEEEIAMEEKEKLEKAERARKRRMEGLDPESEDENRTGKHKKRKNAPQGDDLDDDYREELEDEVSRLGRGLTLDDIQNGITGIESDDNEEEEEGSDDEMELLGQEEGVSSDEEEEDNDDDEEGEGEGETDNEDLLDGEELEFEDNDDDYNTFGNTGKVVDRERESVSKKASQETEKRELPYTFPCPASHAEFLEIVSGFDIDDMLTAVQRMRVLYHIKLSPENKTKLAGLLDALVDHLGYLASTYTPFPTTAVESLGVHIFELAQQLPAAAADIFSSKLITMHSEMAKKMKASIGSPWPDVEDIAILRVLGQVWPTSDLSHPVATPATLFMAQALSQCRVNTETDIGRGIFLTQILYEYQTVSKRYIPEVLNFLSRVITLIAPTSVDEDMTPGLFPMPDIHHPTNLSLSKALSGGEEPITSLSLESLSVEGDMENTTNMTRLSLLQASLRMLEKYIQLYASTPAFTEVFDGVRLLLKQSREHTWHPAIDSLITMLADRLERQTKFCDDKRTKTPLQLQQHRPIPIAQHLPKFEQNYSLDRHYDPDQERAQAKKLQSQFKKEKKGAMRELRKDNMFIARVKAKERKEKDEDYKKMIKGVMSSLEVEQAEKKRYEREKERRRR